MDLGHLDQPKLKDEWRRVGPFSAYISAIHDDRVTLKGTGTYGLKEGEYAIVSRAKDFEKQYPQGGVGSYVEGVIYEHEVRIFDLRYRNIVCPV